MMLMPVLALVLLTVALAAWRGETMSGSPFADAATRSANARTVKGSRVLVAQIMWFHNFGARVRVRIPPASQTTSLSALTGGG